LYIGQNSGDESVYLTEKEMKFLEVNGQSTVIDKNGFLMNGDDGEPRLIMKLSNDDCYMQINEGHVTLWEWGRKISSAGRTEFYVYGIDAMLGAVEDDDDRYPGICGIRNLGSIEFHENNTSTGDPGPSFNRLCTSTDIANTAYTFSDEHIISSLGVKNLIALHAQEIPDSINQVDGSKIEGTDCEVVCTDQNITLEIKNLPQTSNTSRDKAINFGTNPQWCFYIDYDQWCLRYWNLANDDRSIKYESIISTPNITLYGFPQWWMRRCNNPNDMGQARYDCVESTSWQNTGDMKFHPIYDLDRSQVSKYTSNITISSTGPKLGADLSVLPFYRFIGHVFWSYNDINY
jgi:hypothetical protein